MTKRLKPADRKAAILHAALDLAATQGYRRMTREAVATAASVSPALVSLYLGTMPQLQRAVMRAAVRQGVAAVVAQGLAERDPQALKAPDALKREAAALLTR